jgi:hypothetical protein
MQKTIVTLAAATLLSSGCGTTPAERGVSGAGIGAGTGAIVGAVTGITVAQGAVLGAVAGGLTGALTRTDQVNLGDPVWKQRQAAQSIPGPAPARNAYAYAGDASTVRAIQSELKRRGYYTGQVDGIAGPKTAGAIRSYQQQNGLLVDGRASAELLNHMRQHSQS